MPRENVEVVKQSFEAFNSKGLSAIDEYWDPEIVWHTDPLVPEPGLYEGKEAVLTYVQGFIRAFGAWRLDVHEVIDLGGEEVLSVLTALGNPLSQTSQETEFLNWCQIISVRDGKIIRIRSFLDKARAFEAAGLSE